MTASREQLAAVDGVGTSTAEQIRWAVSDEQEQYF
ncbi:hypothetical protein [Candidatus Venteria ishoeyi]|nr:hypothetical protein [Candidatus Venteria ishoeyi]